MGAVDRRLVVNADRAWRFRRETEFIEHDEEAECCLDREDRGDSFGVAACEGHARLEFGAP